MSGQLITDDELESLLQRPVEELGSNFGLSEDLKENLSASALSRAAERALIRTLMLELSVLLRPLDGAARNILIHWTRKFELYNLKALIRGKIQGLSYGQIKENLHDLPSLISLPHEQLLRTENIPELLRQLEQTPYGDIARQARQVFEENNEPFSLDATIDQRYYTGLLKRARSVAEEDRQSLLKLLGSLIDRQNLLWLLRYRFNYQLSPTETYYLLIPSGRYLPADRLKKMVNMESFEQVVEALPEHLVSRMGTITSTMDAEQAMTTETILQARKCLRFSQSAITRSLAYLISREIDLKRIYAIIQGRVLDLDEDVIRQAADIDGIKGEQHV